MKEELCLKLPNQTTLRRKRQLLKSAMTLALVASFAINSPPISLNSTQLVLRKYKRFFIVILISDNQHKILIFSQNVSNSFQRLNVIEDQNIFIQLAPGFYSY